MCVFFFFWLSASHDLRLGMDGMLLALCDHGFERSANVPLIIIITILVQVNLSSPVDRVCGLHVRAKEVDALAPPAKKLQQI